MCSWKFWLHEKGLSHTWDFVWNTLGVMTDEGLSLTADSACGEHVRPFSGSPPECVRAHHGLNAYSVGIVIWKDSWQIVLNIWGCPVTYHGTSKPKRAMTQKSAVGSHSSFPLLVQSMLLPCLVVISSRVPCVPNKGNKNKGNWDSSENQLHYSPQGKKNPFVYLNAFLRSSDRGGGIVWEGVTRRHRWEPCYSQR